MFKRILVLLLLFGSIVFFYHLSRWISWRLAPSVDGVVERVEIAKTLLSPDPRNPVDGWEPGSPPGIPWPVASTVPTE